MDGYNTTQIKARTTHTSTPIGVAAALLGGLMSFFLASEAPEIVFGIGGFYLLIAWLLSTYLSRIQLSWGPKGLAYSDGTFTRYASFAQLKSIKSRIWRNPKSSIAYISVSDPADKELMRIDTRFFSDSDIDLFIRAMENNTRAKIELDEIRELRLENKAAIFCLDEKKNPSILKIPAAKR